MNLAISVQQCQDKLFCVGLSQMVEEILGDREGLGVCYPVQIVTQELDHFLYLGGVTGIQLHVRDPTVSRGSFPKSPSLKPRLFPTQHSPGQATLTW